MSIQEVMLIKVSLSQGGLVRALAEYTLVSCTNKQKMGENYRTDHVAKD